MHPLIQLSLGLLLVMPTTALADLPAQLAKQLGDRDYFTREAASQKLLALGDAAIPALKQVQASGSPEAVRRAQELIRKINVRSRSTEALKPKLVTLDLREVKFQAVAEAIQKQTGYKLALDDKTTLMTYNSGADRKPEDEPRPAARLEDLANRTMTLRLTNRPFWEAVAEIERQLDVEVSWKLRDENILLLKTPLSKDRMPSDNSHSVRVSVKEIPLDLKQVSKEVIPFNLTATSEPGPSSFVLQEWSVTKAQSEHGEVGIDLDSLNRAWKTQQQFIHGPSAYRVIMAASEGLAAWPDPVLGNYLPNNQTVLLKVPPEKPIKKLLNFEGFLRGTFSHDETLMVLLIGDAAREGTNLSAGLKMKARLSKQVLSVELSCLDGTTPEQLKWLKNREKLTCTFSLSTKDYDFQELKKVDLNQQTLLPNKPIKFEIRDQSLKTVPGQQLMSFFCHIEAEDVIEVPFKFRNLPLSAGMRDPGTEAPRPIVKPSRGIIRGGIDP